LYLVRTQIAVRPGGMAQFEDDTVSLGKLRTGLSGYLGQTLLHSYTHPMQYLGMSRWDDVESAWSFNKSDSFTKYIQARNNGVYQVIAQDAWESILDVNADNLAPSPDPSQSGCEVLVDWTISLASAEEFERDRQELFELRKRIMPGFVSSRLRRAAGTPGRYLAINICATPEAARAVQSIPEVQQFNAAHPASKYGATQQAIEAYQVVHRM
jgi:heme-degrading monooxygenase HmoA